MLKVASIVLISLFPLYPKLERDVLDVLCLVISWQPSISVLNGFTPSLICSECVICGSWLVGDVSRNLF